MSDPLTALMHVVQVMNLLKTLTLETLREREETTTYKDEYDSQLEMDTNGGLKRTKSDFQDDQGLYNHSSKKEEGEAASISETEECFLKSLDENTKEFSEELAG
ncbi:hypothetical protein RIF29_34133 [Crotalaria pallida]|uniref:Uncharacterized protein n=1 Tax=Crotalaria pallida TaxID=3830 RepID=A0AAN9EEJ0_CROPI